MDRDMEVPTLDEDCLRIIVRHTHSASTLFAMARVSPGLQKLVSEHLDGVDIWHPNPFIYANRALMKDPLREIGAFLGNQTLVYNGERIVFHLHSGVEQWREFLAALPPLKRIYLRCACMRV